MRKILFSSLFILTVMSLTMTSCSKDNSVSTIEGTWTIVSYKTAGVEFMGSVFTDAVMTFGIMADKKGTFESTITITSLGEDTSNGEYVVSEDGKTVTVTVDGDVTVYTTDMSGNSVKMTGTDEDGLAFEIKGNKK